MNTGQKRLLAVVVIAVVVVGAGVGVFMLMQPSVTYQTPGAPAGANIIKIGVLGDMSDNTGKSCWNGVLLAVKEINSAGGIKLNGTTYYFGATYEDTVEAAAQLDTSKGYAAAQKIISVDGAQFLIGGFRTEAVKSYIEYVMDHKTIFMGTGAATDYFCQNVLDSYNRYKYWFRNTPINSTQLGGETITMLGWVKGYMGALTGKNITHWGILRENLDWTLPMVTALAGAMPAILHYDALDPANNIAFNPATVTETQFATYWNQLNSSKCQVVVPILSGAEGIYMMTQYNATKPQCLVVGIDVNSQLDTFWTDTNGKCAYEIQGQTLALNVNKTPFSMPFWHNFIGNYSHEPIYTGIGGYDSVNLLAWAISQANSTSAAKVITQLETITKSNYRQGAGGNLAFTRSHDVHARWDTNLAHPVWGVAVETQWHPDGKKYCVSMGGYSPYGNATLANPSAWYPDAGFVTGALMLPPWGINNQ
jgi:branched-chain amino acid transport system substrate-binding protein